MANKYIHIYAALVPLFKADAKNAFHVRSLLSTPQNCVSSKFFEFKMKNFA